MKIARCRAMEVACSWVSAFAGVLLVGDPACAQDGRPLIVGTKQAAPFSFRTADGPWQGISIDLWSAIATDLGLDHELREVSLDDLVQGLTDGRFDASVAALTVTSDREKIIDFTHAYYPSGLGIAVPRATSSSLSTIARRVLSSGFLKAVGTLLVVLFLGGAVVWLLERRRNPGQFGGSTAEGLGAALWWSAVTMTTVGYGDKAPVTAGGRIVAVVWMFASVITISGLTAAIASTLTVSHFEHAISGPDDLPRLGRIGCVRGSTGETYLREQHLPYTAYDDAPAAMQGLVDRQVRAAVYDAPILRYLRLTQFENDVSVLPVTFERQDYAIALPLDSPLRKRINQALLKRVSSSDWDDLLYKYLGVSP